MRAFALFITVSLVSVPAIAQTPRPSGSKFIHIRPAEKTIDNGFDSNGNYPAHCPGDNVSCIKYHTQPGGAIAKQTIADAYDAGARACGGRTAYGEVARQCFEARLIKSGLSNKLYAYDHVDSD